MKLSGCADNDAPVSGPDVDTDGSLAVSERLPRPELAQRVAARQREREFLGSVSPIQQAHDAAILQLDRADLERVVLEPRGHAGGLSTATAQAVDVLDAAGFDWILVETVGAGQSDVAIAKLARTRVVVYPPGLGDEVQALKAGVLEIADIVVVNKADLPGADSTARDLLLVPARRGSEDKRPVLKTVSTTGDGVAKLVDVIAEHALHSKSVVSGQAA